MARGAEFTQATYDLVAPAYDHLFGCHIAPPNARLTRGLGLRPGEHIADLACGTGLFTLDMARLVAPGAVVAVDYSEGMLGAARDRALAAGYNFTLVHAKAEDFIASALPGSFDVISMRMLLTYIPWRQVLPRVGRLLRPHGRVGIVTSLTTSMPQLSDLLERFRNAPGPAWKLYKHCNRSVRDTLRLYRRLRENYADGGFITVPSSSGEVTACLGQGGLATTDEWTERVRVWFDSGRAAIDWVLDTGYATHEALDRIGPEGIGFLLELFGAGMEAYREREGVPLDLVMSGIVAERR